MSGHQTTEPNTERDASSAPARRIGMQPENVTVLVLTALLVGLVIGHALGRRQGLEIRRVVLPGDSGAADELAASAPPAPTTLAEARAMVDGMADADAETLIALGDRKLSNGHPLLAIAFYEKALTAEPDRPDVWCGLGTAFHETGQDDDALRCYDEALARRPDHAKAWYHRGVAAAALNRRDEAIQAFRRYLELQPRGDWATPAKDALKSMGG